MRNFTATRLSWATLCLLIVTQLAATAAAVTTTWTQNGATLSWSTGANWDSGEPTGADDAVLPTPIPNPGAFANPEMLTLSSGEVANSLSIFDNYTLSGGTLNLTSGTIFITLGNSSTIGSQLVGSGGLTKLGGGSVRLADNSNSYTGATTIANGSIIITNPGALGADASPIVVTESNTVAGNANTIGFPGGSLVLDGSAGGFTFSRDLSLQGAGPINARGGAVLSIGDNTLSGLVDMANGLTKRNTRILSNNGTLTFSGTLNAAGTAGTTISTLGGINTAGAGGSFAITGPLTGTGTLEKSGAGTLFLTPSDTSGFSGRLRISGSASGGQSSVRVTSLNDGANTTSIFGTVNGTNANAPIDMNGGVLEIRSDSSLNFGKNVYSRASSTYFADHAVGGQAVNGTVTFGTLRAAANTTATFNGRNGYGMTFGVQTMESSNNNSTFNNNLGGLLTFTGNFWNNSDGSARTLSLGGSGNTVITGNINTSGAGTKTLTKTGSGSLTIKGTGTTLNGPTNINGGAVVITDFRSLNNNTANINIGTSTTAGALIVGTDVAATAAGLTTSKVINLASTTGTPSIYANQAGANPVILNANFTATGAGAKTLTLGGTNTADNIINGIIPNSTSNTSLMKIGSGTWVLAGANTYAGATTLVDGTLKLKANAATSTVLPSANAITFGNSNGFSGATLEFVGQNGVNNVQNLGTLTTGTSGANTIRLTPGAGGTASLTFANLTTGGAGSVNFVGGDFINNQFTVTQVNGSAGGDGLVSRTLYWEGADFAYRQATVLRAPVYGTDAGFAIAGAGAATLVGSNNNRITGDITAQTTVSVPTLKFDGSWNLTLGAGQTVTLTSGGVLATGGDSIITGGSALALGTGTLVARVNQSTDSLTIGSVITGSGGLTKNGEGTLILSAANAQTGTVTINEGTVQLSGSGRLGASNAALTMRQGTVLDLNGVTPSTDTAAFNNNGIVTNTNATAVTFTVGGSNGTGTSFGIIDQTNGVINVTKLGTGAQSWFGQSTYTGATTIGSTGLVTVDYLADGGLASGIGASSSAASNLVFNGSTGGLVYAGSIRDGNLALGSRSASTDRLFTLAGTGATLSSTVSQNNSIVWSNTGAIVHGVTGPQTLIFTGTSAGDNTFNPQLTDSGVGTDITSVTKTGTGQWNLGNANNTYTGITTVAEGILALNQNGALPANSPVVLGTAATSGILQMSGTFERNLTATPIAGTGSITWGGTTGGGGFAAHTDKLVVAIGGIASPTALTWGSGGFVGTNDPAQILVLSSATALGEVEFRNDIDLNGANRTITVNDNGNTGTDFATISGLLSGATASLTKSGSGALRLTGANTYGGTTTVTAGTLVVASLGNSASPGASSVGDSTLGNTDAGAIQLGNGGTGAGLLQYIGPGETSDRKIRLNTTTGSDQIHADGSGPLVLTNLANDMVAGAKPLYLRGTNADGNMITSQLSDNGGALSVNVDGSATWILTNGANDYSGTTTVGAGALGIGHDAALGTGNLDLSNGSTFAYGADRTVANPVRLVNNTTTGVIGDHSLTFTNTFQLLASANNVALNNNLVSGKTLTFGNVTANSMTANRTLTIDGAGETVIAGDITTSTAFNLNITKNGTGTLNLTNPTGTNYKGTTTVNGGTLLVNNTSGSGTSSGTVNVNALGTLGGSGFIDGVVNINSGTLAPGNSPGQLTLNNNLTFTGTNPVLRLDLDGPVEGTGYDQIVLNGGTLTLGAGITSLVATNSGLPFVPEEYFWIVNDTSSNPGINTLTNYFAGLPTDGSVLTVNNRAIYIYYNANYDLGTLTGGNDILLTTVPEPSTLAMLVGLGAAGLLGLLRRRRRN